MLKFYWYPEERYFIHYYSAISHTTCSNAASWLWCRAAADPVENNLSQNSSRLELLLLHSPTCWSGKLVSPHWAFLCRLFSISFSFFAALKLSGRTPSDGFLNWACHFYTASIASLGLPAPFCHLLYTFGATGNVIVNSQDGARILRIHIAILMDYLRTTTRWGQCWPWHEKNHLVHRRCARGALVSASTAFIVTSLTTLL